MLLIKIIITVISIIAHYYYLNLQLQIIIKQKNQRKKEYCLNFIKHFTEVQCCHNDCYTRPDKHHVCPNILMEWTTNIAGYIGT